MDKFLYEEGSTEIDSEEAAIALMNQEEEDEDYEDFGYVYDSSQEPIKVFACKHAFHERCLEKNMRKRKKNESDEAYRRRIEKLRCPTCNLKNYEIEGRNQSILI